MECRALPEGEVFTKVAEQRHGENLGSRSVPELLINGLVVILYLTFLLHKVR